MKKLFFIIGLIVAALTMQSCASIVTRTSYPVTFESDPNNASIKITNNRGMTVFAGKTPSTVVLRASDGFFSRASYNIEYTKPGYQRLVFPFDARIDGWYFGNIFLGGFLGMLIIDPATGAMWKLDDYVFAQLAPEDISEIKLGIMDINDLTDEQKAKLIPLK